MNSLQVLVPAVVFVSIALNAVLIVLDLGSPT